MKQDDTFVELLRAFFWVFFLLLCFLCFLQSLGCAALGTSDASLSLRQPHISFLPHLLVLG